MAGTPDSVTLPQRLKTGNYPFMKLHRYFGSHADTTLSEGRLRLTHASSLNDPFEFFHRNVGELEVSQMERFIRSPIGQERIAGARTALEEWGEWGYWSAKLLSDPTALARHYVESKPAFPNPDTMGCHKVADDYLRICCFTNPDEVRPLDEILLWSHYAAKHTGVRIEFDFDPEITATRFDLLDVLYEKHRVAIDYPAVVFGGEEVPMHTQEVIRTKSEAWTYEAEVRLVCSAVGIESQDGKPGVGYVEFEPSWVSGVDFGINCPEDEVARICNILSDKYPKDVVRRRAVRHLSDFSMEYIPM
jgi:hypothetical protein